MLFLATVEQSNSLFALFENNLINWLLLIVLLFWLGNKYLPGAFRSRQNSIETMLREASQARAEGIAFLEAQQKKIANAEKEAEKILVDARHMAEQMRTQLEEQTRRELDDLRLKVEQQIAGERQVAITQLRAAAASAAVALTEATLASHVTAQTRQRLISQFVEQLEDARK
jgi:F-type H+-transporting ATPase subunit b